MPDTDRAPLLGDYEGKGDAYYGNARADYVALLPDNPSARILELGCGDGATGALALSERKCGEFVGIEMFEPMAARARAVLTRVFVGNVEGMELPYPPGTFDALILSEVLEHLVDPLATLKTLVPLVRKGGLVLASSPNVSHHSVLRRLLRGDFTYESEGLMDRTHLRWFTPTSFRKMFEEAGVAVDRVGPLVGLRRYHRWFSKLFLGKFEHLAWYQINLHGHRAE